MGDVISFKKSKQVAAPKAKSLKSKSSKKTEKSMSRSETQASGSRADEVKRSEADSLSQPKRSGKKKESLNAESIKLWWISQEFDELIRRAVLEKHIPVEELSAVMAHRLGTLLMVSERTPELTLFCMKIISRITNQPKPGSNAS